MRSIVAGLAALVLGATAAVVPGTAVRAATPAPAVQKVGLIGDSTLLGLTYNPSAGRNSDARSIISAKYGLFWGVASCQRLVAPSCGHPPPITALQQMQGNAGQLGQVLVVMGGYDDAEIGTGVDAIVAEAARQGVGTVLWLTYRTGDLSYQYASNYVGFNAVLRATAQQYGSMVLADWDAYSHDHPEWMTDDGVHVNSTGAFALADFILDQIAAQTPSRCGGAAEGDPSSAPAAIAAASAPAGNLTTRTPERIVDTRPGDGDGYDVPLGAGHAMKVGLHAAGASAAAVNLTAVGPCASGYLTAYPCNAGPPLASNVNHPSWRTTATAATVMLDAAGDFCIYSYASTDVVVDVFGVYGSGGSGYTPITPTRLVDTRPGAAASALRGALVANTPATVKVAGANGVPANATAVSFNLTAVLPTTAVYVTAYPCSATPPTVSNLNALAGTIVANRVVVDLDATGSLCLVANGGVDVVVDITGSYGGGGSRYTPSTPTRLADTRSSGRLGDGGQLTVTVPGGGRAAAVSVTAVNPRAAGFVTVAPCGTKPLVSSLNYVAGDLVTNLADTALDSAGRLCITTSMASDLVVDLAGVWKS
jgi:hypothetical protein